MKIAVSSAKAETTGYRRLAQETILQLGLTPVPLDDKWGMGPCQVPDATAFSGVFSEVMESDALIAFQVGDGAGDFEDAGVDVAVGVERPRVSQPAVI
jgi:hypothetical protein